MVINKFFNKIDTITFVYIFIVTIIIYFFSNNTNLIISHTIGIIGLILFLLLSKKFNLKVLKDWYPLIIVSFLYNETGYLNQIFFKGFWDNLFYKFETNIFGKDIGIYLVTLFNSRIVNELMYMFYFSYYILIPTLGFFIYFKKKDFQYFYKFLFTLMFTFYFCYLLYIFIPLAGPFELVPYKINGFIFDKIIHFFYKYGELPGSAMPSSHVAVAFIVVIFSKKFKKLFYLFLTDFIFLSISTIYLRYHYVLDVIAGILTGIICFYFCKKILNPVKIDDNLKSKAFESST